MAEDGHYNSSHRAFLQAFLARSTLTFEDAKPLLAAILSAHEGRPTLTNDITFSDFDSYIHTVNAAIQPFDYEVRSIHAQSATSRSPDAAIYALVNATSDPQTQLATSHSPDEIAFVKRLLDAMFDTNNTLEREVIAVKTMDAIRLAKVPRDRDSAATQTQNGPTQGAGGPATSLTLDRAEKVVDSLIDEGWLEKSHMGFLTLSPRALMELRSWLIDTYNDLPEGPPEEEEDREWQKIKSCEGCKQIVTVGQRCSNRECICRLHDFCVQTFFRGQLTRKCPHCQSDWTGNDFVGERAARGASSHRQPPISNRRRGSATMVEDETDDPDE